MQQSRRSVPPGVPTRGYRRQRRWPNVSWWLSAILVVALTAWAITLLVRLFDDDSTPASPEHIAIIVSDAVTGQAVQDAELRVGDAVGRTNESGAVLVPLPDEPITLTITHAGYNPVYGQIDSTMAAEQRVALNPVDPNQVEAQPAPTQDAGQVVVMTPTSEQTTAQETPVTGQGGATGVNGRVVDASGNPIEGAVVLAGSDVVFSDADGQFQAPTAQTGQALRVWASGYTDQFPTATGPDAMTVQMERLDIKAAYLTGARLADEARINELIGTIETTELNALVIDIKEGSVYYDTGVQFFIDAGAVQPLFDPAALVQRLKEKGIYTIARIVVFNDPIVAQNRPDLALKDVNGGIWLGWNGAPWVDPFHRELWQPNIDLALEAAAMGFDEVQYDYVRFPSDGDLNNADFAGEYTSEEVRVGTIVEFLEMTQEQLRPTGVKLGADVFGIIAVYPEDQGIGQRMLDFAEVVDFIHPMVYPSHFNEGSIGVDGHPNSFPYETLDITIGLGQAKMPGMELKMRPWLQDFTLGDPPYGPEQVRAQIDATMDNGASGWMLWNADSEVTVGALNPA
ncbi:MAG: hypothetical protein KF883_15740 [Thermomicrobiales bacterium]|nr:hypothetical protein [Thermomicrobiales bacterium]